MSTVFNGKILVKDTQTADNNDKIVAISSNGEIKESTITNQQLENASNVSEWSTSSGTRAGDNLEVIIGDYDETSSGTKLSIRDEDEEVKIQGASLIELKGILKFRSNTANSGLAIFEFTGANDKTYILPSSKGGTFAMTSDIPVNANFYEEDTAIGVSLVDAGGGATYSFTTPLVRTMTRIGNQVTVKIYINNITTTGTPTGRLVLNSPIFTTIPSVDAGNSGACTVSEFTGGSENWYSVQARGSGTTGIEFLVQKAFDGSNNTYVTASTISSGAISVSITYTTNVYTP